MERGTVSRIEDWDARPVTGGYAGLADLAAAEFTGAVAAGGTHLFMLNGRVVGVFDGSMSAFEGADATAYEAPDPSLPLLFAMRERGGDVRGKYYTDDTPLREVDQTLTEGGFTGFLELSENVLSGDYYVVYYGGRSLAAAFVGNKGRVVTGDEAFDLASDEVGIYEVRSVNLEVEDVPEPPEDASAGTVGGAAAAGAAGAAGAREAAGDDGVDEEAAIEDVEAEPDGRTGTDREEDQAAEAVGEGDAAAETEVEPEAGEEEPDDEPVDEEPTGPESADEAADPPETDTAEPDAGTDDAGADEGSTPGPAPESVDPVSDERAASTGARRPTGGEHPREAGEPDARFREEERWREARTVPALDPDETELPPAPDADTGTEPAPVQEAEPTSEPGPATDEDAEVEALRERIRELESRLESAEQERRREADRAEALAEERDELAEEAAALEERIEELEAAIEEKEARLEAQESEIAAQARSPSETAAAGAAPAETIGEEEALDQTDLFVRYRSKGQATLQTAHDGRADREAVRENLRLENHSRFDADGVAVDGRPFREYLADTIEYRFVAWLVEELLYEIRETGSERGLRGLYDALPKIDRAEFGGTVTSVDEDGNEREETFDVVCRDRMGKPLVVANINDSLDPASGEMMGGLVGDATAAAEAHESVGAAFLVTASFFEPDALETASDATGGGFLSRDSKKSFVKLSRKGGYHLCLVEARGGDFHVAVPEL